MRMKGKEGRKSTMTKFGRYESERRIKLDVGEYRKTLSKLEKINSINGNRVYCADINGSGSGG